MSALLLLWSWRESAGLVVAAGVEGEGSDQLAGVAVDDSDVEVGDQHQDLGSGEAAPESDVVEPGVVPDGDAPGLVDGVVADSPVRVDDDSAGGGLGAGGVGVGGGAACDCAVRADVVVVVAELVERGLQLPDCAGGVPGEPLLLGLVEVLDAPMFVKPPRARSSALTALWLGAGGCCRSRGRCSA